MDKKALNLPILLSLVIGNMIGTGIYVLPASLATFGSLSLISWVYTSCGAILLALTLANLNKRFPFTGGPYVYCKKAYGRFAGFIVAYTYWLSNLVSIAGLAVASIGYLGFLTTKLNANTLQYDPYLALGLELAAVWIFTLINLIGIHTAGVVQLFLTIIKILPLALVTVIGLMHIQLINLVPTHTASTFTTLNSAAALTFWAFIGLESATVPAESTTGSQQIFKATLYGTLLTSLIYMLSTFVLMGMIPAQQLQTSQFPFAQAGSMLFGSYAAMIIVICAVISGFGALNGCVLIQGQLVFAAARDKFFPKQFAHLSKHDVPIRGQLFSTLLISIFLVITQRATLLSQFNHIALLAALLTLMTYFATTLAELKFLLYDKIAKKFWQRKASWIAFFASVYALWMISCFDALSLLYSLILLGIATLFYCIFN